MNGLIPLVRRLEAALDVYRASADGTAEHALARDEVADIRRRLAALPIDQEARSTGGTASGMTVVPPYVPRRPVGWRRASTHATITRR